MNIIRYHDNNIAPLYSPPLGVDYISEGSLTMLKKLELASLWATELRLAVEDGLTVRTLMVRTHLTHKFCIVSLPHVCLLKRVG
jgi:hypothetical protein